jgi:hypothetical protein
MDKIISLIHFSGVSNSSGFGGFSPNVAASQSPRTRQGSWPWPRILRTERRKPSGWTKCRERVEGGLSITVGFLLVLRATLAQAQKPRRPTKNGSIQDGTILGIRRLGNLAVPFRLSPRWQECLIA